MKRVRRKVDEWTTTILRRITPVLDEKSRLEKRIRQRISGLGRIYEDGNSDIIGYTYHPIPFPGYENVGSHREECATRLQAILHEVQIRPGDRILDVGANVGFFSFSLEKLGGIVESYESQSDCFEIGAALSRLYNTNVIYINKPMATKTLPYLHDQYRVGLLLSVFHWIVKQEGIEAASKVLQDIVSRCQDVFFEVPCDPHDAMFKHELFTSREKTFNYLCQVLPNARIKSIMEDPRWAGRVLYRISRESVG